MTMLKMTRNGQITLPKQMREKLSMREGSRMIANFEGDRIIIAKQHDPEFWKTRKSVLPENMHEILATLRKGKWPRYL